jgi:tRNA G18 (ribose-2'-O)-methylase SpoU
MNRKVPNDELERLSENEYKVAPKVPIVVVLDNIRSGQNVGAVFRSSDAFRIEKVCLCGITSTPPSREINKTALGSSHTVDWEYFANTDSCISRLRAEGYVCIAVEQTENSETLGHFITDTSKKYAIVFGNEVEGVSQNVVDRCNLTLEVPQYGTKHSLNISVCAGIVMWEMAKAFHLPEKRT